jgi:uncharacterized protein YaiE (UPF0345 family)
MCFKNKFPRVIFIIAIFTFLLCNLSYAADPVPIPANYDIVLESDLNKNLMPPFSNEQIFFYLNEEESFDEIYFYKGVVYYSGKTHSASFSFDADSKTLNLVATLYDGSSFTTYFYNLQSTDGKVFEGLICSIEGVEIGFNPTLRIHSELARVKITDDSKTTALPQGGDPAYLPIPNNYDVELESYSNENIMPPISNEEIFFYLNAEESFAKIYFYKGVVYYDGKTHTASFSFDADSQTLSLVATLYDGSSFSTYFYNLESIGGEVFEGLIWSIEGVEIEFNPVVLIHNESAKVKITDGWITALPQGK